MVPNKPGIYWVKMNEWTVAEVDRAEDGLYFQIIGCETIFDVKDPLVKQWDLIPITPRLTVKNLAQRVRKV